MKKIVALTVIFVCAGAALFALDMAVGGGLHFDMSFGNGINAAYEEDYFFFKMSYDIKQKSNVTSFGAFGFFDLTYAVVDLNFAVGSITDQSDIKVTMAGVTTEVNTKGDGGSMTQLGISLMGKYPIELSSFTIFPLLGINYNLVLSMKDAAGNSFNDGDESSIKWLSQLGFLAGAGMDFPINDFLFLRANALLQIRLPNKMAKDYADAFNGDATLGFGPRIQVGLGYRL